MQISYCICNGIFNHTLGKYGRMRRVFLAENNSILLDDMILTETLFPHLWEIDETAHRRVEQIMTELLEKNPAPDKSTQQLAWVQHMSSLILNCVYGSFRMEEKKIGEILAVHHGKDYKNLKKGNFGV